MILAAILLIVVCVYIYKGLRRVWGLEGFSWVWVPGSSPERGNICVRSEARV